jgi:thiamine pyrophosphokinase
MKDVTDTHYALSEACELGYGQIIVFGGTGSRLDHTLANMMVAFNYEGHNMTFIQEHNIVDVCHGQRQYVGPCEQIRKLIIGEYQYLSLIPVESTYIASTTGLKYPIRNQWLKVYDSLGVSNELCDHDYQIEVGDGKLLIVYSRD